MLTPRSPLQNDAGTALGTLAQPLRTDPVGSTPQTVSGAVSVSPSTTGGYLSFSNTALTNTVVSVKASAAGQVGGWALGNAAAAWTYLQFFDAATAGAVTLGATTPKFVMPVPAGAAANMLGACGMDFSSGIQVAATTTPSGSTAPGTALCCGIFYE